VQPIFKTKTSRPLFSGESLPCMLSTPLFGRLQNLSIASLRNHKDHIIKKTNKDHKNVAKIRPYMEVKTHEMELMGKVVKYVKMMTNKSLNLIDTTMVE
jgi:hypothetical protein